MRARLTCIVAVSVLVLLCISCREGGPIQLPTAPPAPPSNATTGFVAGYVVEGNSGLCIIGAVVEIVDGPNVGQKIVQNEACSVWDDAGWNFSNLPLGVPIRIRATKDGYRPEELQVMAITRGQGIIIRLVRQ